jgi:hypothetical protein
MAVLAIIAIVISVAGFCLALADENRNAALWAFASAAWAYAYLLK